MIGTAFDDRELGIARVAGIDGRDAAQQEARPAVARDHLSVGAGRAQACTVEVVSLPGPAWIVHHAEMFTSEATTRGVRVQVRSEYAAERSQPSRNQWFFLYTVTITNEGTESVQLLTRHWIITDGAGQVDEVKGPGVVGKQPTLAPGESFEYTSGCPLSTPFGIMEGTYQMVAEGGDQFDARIAPFTLSEPYTVH